MITNVASNGSILRKDEFGEYGIFTYDGQMICLPFFPLDFTFLPTASFQQHSSSSSKIICLNPEAMVPKTE